MKSVIKIVFSSFRNFWQDTVTRRMEFRVSYGYFLQNDKAVSVSERLTKQSRLGGLVWVLRAVLGRDGG